MVQTKKRADPKELAALLLRIGLAFVFFYAAIASFISPQNWIGFFPKFLRNVLSASFLLTAFSVYEIILGLWLLSNKKIFYCAILSAIVMLAIVVTSWAALDVVFRDVAIFFMALALAVLTKNE